MQNYVNIGHLGVAWQFFF